MLSGRESGISAICQHHTSSRHSNSSSNVTPGTFHRCRVCPNAQHSGAAVSRTTYKPHCAASTRGLSSGVCIAAAAVAGQTHDARQHPTQGTAESQPPPAGTDDPQHAAALRVLRALCHYAPLELTDGPATLSKVRPYNATEVAAALQLATQQRLLHLLELQQLSNAAAALAAAGHLDPTFMQQLGDAAAASIKASPRLLQQPQALRAFRTIAWLAVAFSRLGVLHPALMEQVAVYGTHLLQRCPLNFSKRKHGQQVALLATAFAALRLYPPQLYRAIGEHLKQHRQLVTLLGAQEAMLLLWAFARVGHKDPPAQLWITQRATTQVGQLTCEGLAHAYTQCAAVGISSAPLLAALRKACRVKLSSMQPAQLTALLVALAGLGQQDLLYLDEIAKSVYNKLANVTPAEVVTTLTALAALRYRNPWLLEQASKMLVSRRLRKAPQLTPAQLAELLAALRQLAYLNPLLLGHLGAVAVEVQLPGCTPAELAAVVAGYRQLGFFQPQLLQAAAARLLQLVVQSTVQPPAASEGQQLQEGAADDSHNAALRGPHHHHQQQQQQQQQKQQEQRGDLPQLISAALHLASLPPAAGSSAEKAVLPAALLGLAAQALVVSTQHTQQHVGDTALRPSATSSGSSSDGGSGPGASSLYSSLQDVVALHTALLLLLNSSGSAAAGRAASTAAMGPPAAAAVAQAAAAGDAHTAVPGSSRQQQMQLQLSEVRQQLEALQQQVQRGVQRQLQAAVAACAEPAAAAAAATELSTTCPGLLQCMQLVWLADRAQVATAAGSAVEGGGDVSSQHPWRLGLPAELADAFVLREQQKQQQGVQPTAQAVAAAVGRIVQAAASQQQESQHQVLEMHTIPSGPVLVPVAVLPAGMAAGDDVQTAADTHDKQQQQQAGGASGVFLHVATQLQRRKVQLPSEAWAFIRTSLQQQRPLAVFLELRLEREPVGMGVGGEQGGGLALSWFTRNDPQQLLPAARLWRQGLMAAGWDVLVLEDAPAPDSSQQTEKGCVWSEWA